MSSHGSSAGGHRQAWPDPHTDRDPVEDEYSRVSRPERYVILEARRQAWVDALQRRGLACITARPDSPSALDQACPNGAADLTRRWTVTPVVGGQPLHLAARVALDDFLTVDVGFADPVIALARFPDCGCDACDSDSADLLETFDRTLLAIVDGCVEVVVENGHRCQRTAWDSTSGADWPPGDNEGRGSQAPDDLVPSGSAPHHGMEGPRLRVTGRGRPPRRLEQHIDIAGF